MCRLKTVVSCVLFIALAAVASLSAPNAAGASKTETKALCREARVANKPGVPFRLRGRLDRAARKYPHADVRLLRAVRLIHDSSPNEGTLKLAKFNRARVLIGEVCDVSTV
jgi:hypothetical protein